MSTRTAATRYAKALLDVAATDAAAAAVDRDLAGLVEAMHANRELQQALTRRRCGRRQAEDRRRA